MRGAITKLKIDTYKDNSYSPSSKIKSNAFEAVINPTSFSIAYKTLQNNDQEAGSGKANVQYVSSLAPSLQIEFLFDGTGVMDANSGNKLINTIKKIGKVDGKSVTEQIKAFYDSTGELIGPIHKPYNVGIRWGFGFEFKGILADFTVEYKLFDNEGKPLRASVKATFNESISPELREKLVKKNSPDLTHKRTVQDGDTLPLMTERIYGDSKYYLEVAKVNGLINFRQLKPGSELYFPPLEKKS